jgi:hypothetical protein
MVDQKAALQSYMDAIAPAINSALNQLARERPDEPLKALSQQLACAEPAKYRASPALCKMMGKTCADASKADEVIAALVSAGVLARCTPKTRDSQEEVVPVEQPAAAAVAVRVNHARALWHRAFKPALQRSQSTDNAWSEFGIHKRPTE